KVTNTRRPAKTVLQSIDQSIDFASVCCCGTASVDSLFRLALPRLVGGYTGVTKSRVCACPAVSRAIPDNAQDMPMPWAHSKGFVPSCSQPCPGADPDSP